MTEEEWLSATDPTPMLEFLRGKASDRKLRLFAVACCGRVDHLVSPYCRQFGKVLERYADGNATDEEVNLAYEVAYDKGAQTPAMAFEALAGWQIRNGLLYAVAAAADNASCGAADTATGFPDDPEGNPLWVEVHCCEQAKQTDLFRDIFNPFHPVSLKPAWQTSTVLALAQGIYQDRAFDRLPILADALQDASCDNPDLLNHLRPEGPHTRGCWALDACLGKE